MKGKERNCDWAKSIRQSSSYTPTEEEEAKKKKMRYRGIEIIYKNTPCVKKKISVEHQMYSKSDMNIKKNRIFVVYRLAESHLCACISLHLKRALLPDRIVQKVTYIIIGVGSWVHTIKCNGTKTVTDRRALFF